MTYGLIMPSFILLQYVKLPSCVYSWLDTCFVEGELAVVFLPRSVYVLWLFSGHFDYQWHKLES